MTNNSGSTPFLPLLPSLSEVGEKVTFRAESAPGKPSPPQHLRPSLKSRPSLRAVYCYAGRTRWLCKHLLSPFLLGSWPRHAFDCVPSVRESPLARFSPIFFAPDRVPLLPLSSRAVGGWSLPFGHCRRSWATACGGEDSSFLSVMSLAGPLLLWVQ